MAGWRKLRAESLRERADIPEAKYTIKRAVQFGTHNTKEV